MPSMIYYTPYGLRPGVPSASAVRPIEMLQAFHDAGFEVFEITGTARERKKRIQVLKKQIRAGKKFDFCYSESSTQPNMMTEPKHFPLVPFLDARFFSYLKRKKIPTGIFYRDIYWRFPEYRTQIPRIVDLGLKVFYHWDLVWYKANRVTLFLPSLRMGKHVPTVPSERFVELPPGAKIRKNPKKSEGNFNGGDLLNLFFVGGIGPNYQLHEAFKAVAETPGVSMTICVPQKYWEQVKPQYEPFLCDRIEIVSGTGEELEKFYDQADIGLLFTKPISYWDFAVPVKLYEYIGNGKPIVAASGSNAGRIVEQLGAGWVLPYETEALKKLLEKLIENPHILREAAKSVKSIQEEQTWKARAKFVAEHLSR
ncbi:hypothetical protein BSR29_00790 [Boudabousia liubingyangii]|uniref:Glycosyl transferase family 1 domain-containing protein n=1 Tax=Boudabousia liubingyangii TaxID=1921764 RepID=A0A1Q5PPS8_9ACTO|nr:glycosyltransferase [Boudabousia liubingyangii]OKL49526.1 hypothetical protein BSR29_00790 [Boudabousia liubingyangii]